MHCQAEEEMDTSSGSLTFDFYLTMTQNHDAESKAGVLFRRGPGFRNIKQASLSHWVAEYNLKVSSVN